MGTVLEAEDGIVEGAAEGAATIFALSSGAPPAGIAVVRVSGDGVRRVLKRLVGIVPAPRRATLRGLVDPESGEEIDRGLVLFFPGPQSYTGEDLAEFHIHGGRAVVAALLRALSCFPGFRPAEPGEFTRRAFLAGRLDLTEAEGVADLVAADTEAQRRAALGHVQGSIRKQYESWAAALTRARGLIEAELDFAEEENLGSVWSAEGRDLAALVGREMEDALAGFDRARGIREGLEVMLLGPVNVGKSTLLNAIAGRDVAIVSPEAGTTRDLIEVAVDLGGFKVTLIDGAGLRETDSLVEREGVRRARERAGSADLVLWLSDGSPPPDGPSLTDTAEVWTVATKADLAVDAESIRLRNEADFVLSARTGAGVEALLDDITRWAAAKGSGDPPVVTRERHRAALRDAIAAVRSAAGHEEPELAADDLRRATEAIGRITGRIDVEAVLDIVFREFCIGK